jgi:hypothetical protein
LLNFRQKRLALGARPQAKSSKSIHEGEPNYFSPNANTLLVDAIVLSAPTVAPPDIPNSAIHFQTILFCP